MDAASKRRESRRRRLQQNPEERLRKIRDLKCGIESVESSPKNETGAHTVEAESASQSIVKLEQVTSDDHRGQDTEDGLDQFRPQTTELGKEDHVCPDIPASVHLERARPSQEPAQATSLPDLSTLIPSFLVNQFLFDRGQKSTGVSSYKTIFTCSVAVLFRLLLELDWVTTFTGQSMVMIFFAVYLPWLYFFENQRVNFRSAPAVIFLALDLVQDFAVYLVTFVAGHWLISLVTELRPRTSEASGT